MKKLLLTTMLVSTVSAGVAADVRAETGEFILQDARAGTEFRSLGAVLGLMVIAAAMGGGQDEDAATPDRLQPLASRDLFGSRRFSDLYFRPGAGIDEAALRAALTRDTLPDRFAINRVRERADVKWNSLILNTGASVKIAAGYTGAGVKLGLVDDLADPEDSNLAHINWGGVFNPYGVDLRTPSDVWIRHGSLMAQIIAGRPGDGDEVRGIAPGVTLYNIHGSYDGVSSQTSPGIRGPDSVMRYVADQRLDIASLGVVYNTSSSVDHFITSEVSNGHLLRAVANGTLFVVPTGAESAADPTNILAQLGTDSRMRGQVISVAALDWKGNVIDNMSDRCGLAMHYCVVSPGAVVYMGRDGKTYSHIHPSVAAAGVSGIVALLKEQYPELSPSELAELLFVTADDLGEEGVDAVYGRGAVNVGRAILPQGNLRLVTGSAVAQSSPASDHYFVASAPMAGPLREALKDQSLILIDDFNRGFSTTADKMILTSSKMSLSPLRPSGLSLNTGGIAFTVRDGRVALVDIGGRFRLSYGNPEEHASHRGPLAFGYDPRAWVSDALAVSAGFGDNHTVGVARRAGDGALAGWATTAFEMGDAVGSAEVGIVREKSGLAGVRTGAGNTTTGYLSASVERSVRSNLSFGLTATIGQSRFSGGTLITDASLRTASMRLTANYRHKDGSETSLALGTPLSFTGGHLDVDAAVARAPWENAPGGVTRQKSRHKVRGHSPVDFGLSHSRPVGSHSDLSLSAAIRKNGGRSERWVSATFSVRF